MKPLQIAAQLYTVRDLCPTLSATAEVLKKIAAAGYTAVEVAGIGPFETAELADVIRDAGLRVCAFHDHPATVLEEPEKMAEQAALLGCQHVVYSSPFGFDLGKAEDVDKMVRQLAAAGPLYRVAGQTLCYHHHSLEFARYGQGTVLEKIVASVPAEDLSIELDTYWIQHGGGIPAEWCARLAGRVPLLHLKDFGSVKGVPTMMEVGRGNLDWKAIIASAGQAGCSWFIVEQDICLGDPVESLRVSLDYLRSSFPG